jgi:hypothetical protein
MIVIVLAVQGLAGCEQSQADDSNRWRRSGPWAGTPAAVAMPAAAPDDPAAYRGVRFQIGAKPDGMPQVEAAGQVLRWIRTSMGPSYTSARDGREPLLGYQQMDDGRRRMVWFFRFLGPVFTSKHAGAVLDVLELPGRIESGFRTGCSFDPVIIDGDHGWRLNQTSGLIEPVDPDMARCPKD